MPPLPVSVEGDTTIPVNVSSFQQLLEESTLGTKIDFVSIDTEGAEMSILQGIDFNRFSIGVLTIENDYNDDKYCDFLRPKGFLCAGRIGFLDEIFVNLNHQPAVYTAPAR